MQQRQDQAAAAADQQRPTQGKTTVQPFQNRITPQEPAQAANPADHKCHTGAAQSSGEQGHQAEAQGSHQCGSVENSTDSFADFEGGTVLMQARTTLPFTSISQAPQLPPRQPVGMAIPASAAACSQSVPLDSMVWWPLGQRT